MAEARGNWLWNLLRRRSRKELGRLQAKLVKLPGEKRQFAGDPNQPRHLWVKTRNK